MRNFISIDCFVRRLSHPATHRFFFFLFLFCLPNFCFGGFTNFVDYRFITQCTSPTKSQSSSVDCPGEYVDYCCLGVSGLCQKRTSRSRFILVGKTRSGTYSDIILLVFAVIYLTLSRLFLYVSNLFSSTTKLLLALFVCLSVAGLF